MVLLLDTNVIINYLTNRADDNLDSSIKIIALCAAKEVYGFVSTQTFPVIWYALRKQADRRNLLQSIRNILNIVDVHAEDIDEALTRTEFADFEDCLQEQCAKRIEADFIITCNVRDFTHSKIPAITPNEFMIKKDGEKTL